MNQLNPLNQRGAIARAGTLILMTALGLGAVVRADVAVLRTRQPAGPFIVSVFTAPEPLRVGLVEVRVVVQSKEGAVLTDAVVDILLESSARPIRCSRRARQARTRWCPSPFR